MEAQLPPSYEGSVVLEVGGDVGALVLYVPAELLGEELELLPASAGRPRTHTEVRERRAGGYVVHAAVYAALPAGEYVVERSGQAVSVAGGRVTELDWSPSDGSSADTQCCEHADEPLLG